MIQSGDIYLADLGGEVRVRVLVVSTDQFHRASSRSLVAPEVFGESADLVNFPWRVQVDDAIDARACVDFPYVFEIAIDLVNYELSDFHLAVNQHHESLGVGPR